MPKQPRYTRRAAEEQHLAMEGGREDEGHEVQEPSAGASRGRGQVSGREGQQLCQHLNSAKGSSRGVPGVALARTTIKKSIVL